MAVGSVPVPHQTQRPEYMVAPSAVTNEAMADVPSSVQQAVAMVLAEGWPEVESYSARTHAELRTDIAVGIAEQLFPYLFEPVTAAAERIKDLVKQTSFDEAPRLSEQLGNTILIKREDQQEIHSFKGRGASNKMLQLTGAERHGVIAASAGNHAQGVALAAQKLGIPATIVMSEQTPAVKWEAVAARGARIVLHGEAYSDAYEHSLVLQQEEDLTYIHPFDDPAVTEGQATIGLEMLTERPDMTHIFVQIGGGGLIGDMARYIKSVRPDIRIIGVQYDQSDAVAQSLLLNERVKLDYVGKMADGVAVKEPGELTLELIKQHVDELVVVTEEDIRLAMDDIYQETRVYPEAAGALGLAGAKHVISRDRLQNAVIGTILSGSNISPEMIAYNSREVEFLRGKRTSLYIGLPEVPGALREFCRTVVQNRNIAKFEYTYRDDKNAVIAIALNTKDSSDKQALLDTLSIQHYTYTDISKHALRQHAEHLNGGESNYEGSARTFNIEFPECPGALLRFLDIMGDDFSIGRFHYEEKGGDTGQVLITYHTNQINELHRRLAATSYRYEPVDLQLMPGREILL